MTKQPTISLDEKEYLEEGRNDAWDYDGDDEWGFGNIEYNIPNILHHTGATVNQASNSSTKSACTIFGCVSAIQHLFDLKMDIKEANNLGIDAMNYCAKYGGYKPGYGRSTPTAAKYCTDWWNNTQASKRGLSKIFYLRLDWNNPTIEKARKLGHYIGFTKTLDFGNDRYKGLVDKDSYPSTGGHRLNFKSVEITKATGGASGEGCDTGVHDNYYLNTNEYFIKDRKKYMGKGISIPCYLFLREEDMKETTIEETKENIEESKAMNYILMALSSGYQSVPEKWKKKFAELGKEIREDFPNARSIEEDKEKKGAIALTDALSYLFKFANDKYKGEYASLAKNIRNDYNIK